WKSLVLVSDKKFRTYAKYLSNSDFSVPRQLLSSWTKTFTVIASGAKQSQPQANCFISLRCIRNDIV
ncbi:MAG: hypothetical protein ACYTXY_54395, partial [Nostoc sp.]